MRLALNEARKALQLQEVPIGAVVVADGAVVGRGHNLVETLSDPTAHAEMQALTAAASTLGGKYLQGCTLYVTVEPCIMCAGAAGWAQVSRVVWGADDPKKGYRRYSETVFHPKMRGVDDLFFRRFAQLDFEKKEKKYTFAINVSENGCTN